MNDSLTYIRASSLPSFTDCPRRWYAQNIEKMRLPSGPGAQIGTAVHAGTGAYDQSRLDNTGLSIDEATGAVVDAIWHPDYEVAWEDTRQEDAEKIAVDLHRRYCNEIAPAMEYVAVEAKCENLVIDDLAIVLTGTTDRVTVNELGELGIADIKTGKRAVASDGTVTTSAHASQIGVYEILAEHAIGQRITAPAKIIGLQVAKTDKGRRAAVGTINGARDILLGDPDLGRPGLLEIIARMLKSGDVYGNPKSGLCSEKYCPCFNICTWRK